MHIEEFRTYCLSKAHVSEEFPFGPDTLVYKVKGKMFALTGLDDAEFKVNLKVNPERGIELRETYSDIQPGFHMNKVHWITVLFEGGLPSALLRELIDDSYHLVLKTVSKKNKT